MLWTCLTESCNNASLWTSCCSGYFTCNTSKVSFDNGNVPLLILFVNSRNVLFTFPFHVSCMSPFRQNFLSDHWFSIWWQSSFFLFFFLLIIHWYYLLPTNLFTSQVRWNVLLLLTFYLAFVEAMMILYESFSMQYFSMVSRSCSGTEIC